MKIKLPSPPLRLFRLCRLLLIALLLLSAVNAQSPCKLKPVKVKGVLAGKVFLIQGGDRQPLSGVAVDVFERNGRRLASSASSAEDGSYLIKGLDSGVYIIKTTHMVAADLEVELEMTKSENEGADRLVNIILGTDKDKECGGGRVETEKVK
jgi:hypothetical protein